MDIIFFIKILWRRKWYLILIPIITGVASYFFTSGVKPVYKSVARLATGFTTNEDQIKVIEERLNLRDSEVKFNNLIQTINSESVLTLLSYRLAIHDLTSEIPFRKGNPEMNEKSILDNVGIDSALNVLNVKLKSKELLSSYDPFEAKLLKLIGSKGYLSWQIKGALEISRVRGTDFITIQCLTESPLLSAFMANTLGEEFIRYDNSLKDFSSDQSVTFFEKLANEKKLALEEKSKLLTQMKSSGSGVDFQMESAATITQIGEYELRKEQLLRDIQRLNILLANVNKKLNQSSQNNPLGNQAEINSNIIRIKDKIAELNDQYTKSGSTNKELYAVITELRYQLQVEMNKLEQSSGSSPQVTSRQELVNQKEAYELELQIANVNLESVNSMIYGLRGGIAGKASKETAILELEKDVEKATLEYHKALDRFDTERSKSMAASSSIRIIVKAQPNGNPEFSKRLVMIVFSIVVSLVLCVFVIIFVEYLDVRVKNPQQFKKFIKIPLIGTINLINSKDLNLAALFSNPSKDHDLEVFKHFLRKLRFEVETSKGQVILITSPKEGEGKSFIILCLSYLLSMIQKRILIIDTNFKHNSLTKILLKKNSGVAKLEQGLFMRTQIGQGGAHSVGEEDFVSSIIYPTGHHGISIIGNNGGNESPSEIFAGRDFGVMLDTLKSTYDYIILEGPALNNYSDTKELVGFTDKVIAIFSADSSIKELDRESIDYLSSLKGKFLGATLNKVITKELTL
ncbi:MAG: hypothetical protein JNM57_01025 [Cyclobacteriaceae bacterium]|nr:hypothetical protein [Cyclobacteriaceae bacterium]